MTATKRTLMNGPDADVGAALNRIRAAAPALTDRQRRALLATLAALAILAEARAKENTR